MFSKVFYARPTRSQKNLTGYYFFLPSATINRAMRTIRVYQTFTRGVYSSCRRCNHIQRQTFFHNISRVSYIKPRVREKTDRFIFIFFFLPSRRSRSITTIHAHYSNGRLYVFRFLFFRSSFVGFGRRGAATQSKSNANDIIIIVVVHGSGDVANVARSSANDGARSRRAKPPPKRDGAYTGVYRCMYILENDIVYGVYPTNRRRRLRSPVDPRVAFGPPGRGQVSPVRSRRFVRVFGASVMAGRNSDFASYCDDLLNDPGASGLIGHFDQLSRDAAMEPLVYYDLQAVSEPVKE